ncbi:hypothetical protein V2J09_007261 [Rumex salicifolius]
MTLPRGYTLILLFEIALCINETLLKLATVLMGYLQCTAGQDDDLRIRNLVTVRTDFSETTHFDCGFSWGGGRKEFVAFKDDADFLD